MNYDVITFISKYVVLRRPGVAIFANIIRIITSLFKESLKTQEKSKKSEIMYQNAIYICIS